MCVTETSLELSSFMLQSSWIHIYIFLKLFLLPASGKAAKTVYCSCLLSLIFLSPSPGNGLRYFSLLVIYLPEMTVNMVPEGSAGSPRTEIDTAFLIF